MKGQVPTGKGRCPAPIKNMGSSHCTVAFPSILTSHFPACAPQTQGVIDGTEICITLIRSSPCPSLNTFCSGR